MCCLHIGWCSQLQLQNYALCVVAHKVWTCACQLAVFDARRCCICMIVPTGSLSQSAFLVLMPESVPLFMLVGAA